MNDLRKDDLASFLRSKELPRRSGTKEDLQERIEEAISDEELSYTDLVELLDTIEPWDKQHVYLFDGPVGADLSMWRDTHRFEARLKQHRVAKTLGKTLPLALPAKLTITNIVHVAGKRLRVTAVERRDATERDEDRDPEDRVDDGTRVEFRAYVHFTTRGIIAFEWDLVANTAMLQISQLPTRFTYEDARRRFAETVEKWLDMTRFSPVDLSKSIRKFYDDAKESADGITSSGIDWATAQGRRLSGRSASSKQALLGEEGALDDSLENMRRNGAFGHAGNFFFSPAEPVSPADPLQERVHAHILAGDHQRVNFPTANTEEALRHVLQRIRQAAV